MANAQTPSAHKTRTSKQVERVAKQKECGRLGNLKARSFSKRDQEGHSARHVGIEAGGLSKRSVTSSFEGEGNQAEALWEELEELLRDQRATSV